jgi:hypothetical protein
MLSGPGGSAIMAQSTGDTNIVISQLYTRGGEAGAIYQNDFIELYNRGNTVVDINGWTLNVQAFDGTSTSNVQIRFSSPTGVPIPVGGHVLLQFPGNGTNGQPLSPDTSVPLVSLGATGGQIMLLGKDKTPPSGCPAAPDPTGAVVDFVGYGSATCAEGTATLAPSATKALQRVGGGCIDTNNNLADFSIADPNPHSLASAVSPCGGQTLSIINFAAPQFDVLEGQGVAHIGVTRVGDRTTPATVDYFTLDGTASERKDYTTSLGTLNFAAGETQKSFDVLINGDGFLEPDETVFLGLQRATGNASIGPINSASLVIHNAAVSDVNPVDNSTFYADQHYHDFLNRISDPTGLAYWSNNIEICGADTQCREVKRIDTSAAFFLSIEFQQSGYYVYRLNKAAFGDISPPTVPVPIRFIDFVRDGGEVNRGVIVGQGNWQDQLDSNKAALALAFVQRPTFLIRYPGSTTATALVDSFNTNAGNVLTSSERSALIAQLTPNPSDPTQRADVLRKVAENALLQQNESNRAFVLMQYFGYLRRNPDDSPDSNFDGFNFWLGKLNQFGGDFRAAEMVKAFIISTEYRNRFGP